MILKSNPRASGYIDRIASSSLCLKLADRHLEGAFLNEYDFFFVHVAMCPNSFPGRKSFSPKGDVLRSNSFGINLNQDGIHSAF